MPAPAAAERRALIDADLWDEANADWLGDTSDLGRQRLSRLVRGVPADLAWRIEHQRRSSKTPRRHDVRISTGQRVALGLVAIWQVILLVGGLSQPSFREWSGMVPAVIGLGLAIVGIVVAVPRPLAGFLIGVGGILIAFLLMPWLLPFFLPLPIVLGYRLAREPVAGRTTATGS